MTRIAMWALVSCAAALLLPLLGLAQTRGTQSDEAKKFRAYLDEDWKKWMAQLPEMASSIGYPGHNREWTDDSPAGIETRQRHLHESRAALKTISRDALLASEQLNYDLYRQMLEMAEEGIQYGIDAVPFPGVVPRDLWMPMNQMDGVQQG